MKTLYIIIIIIGISSSIVLSEWIYNSMFKANNPTETASGIMNVGDTNSSIKYVITNGTLFHTHKVNKPLETIVLYVNATGSGYLYLTIPRTLLDFKNPNGSDGEFVVFEDGQEVDFTEVKKTQTERSLGIPFVRSTNIDVVKPNPS